MVIVQKYGGSSLGSIEKIKYVAKKVIDKKRAGSKVVVVVSAMGDTTDHLIDRAKTITNNPDRRELDRLLSTGEQVSAALLSIAIKSMGEDSVSFTGPQVGILTTDTYTNARILSIDNKKIMDALNNGKIVVITGFQGVSHNGDITTLGRGGSDTSAVAIAASLGAKCEIYTDVDGIYTADPRKVSNPKKLSYISYDAILELASLGAKVMHSRSIEIAKKFNVEVYVASTFSNEKGTLIAKEDEMEEMVVTGITSNEEEVKITVYNLSVKSKALSRLFGKISSENVNVDMISETAISHGFFDCSFTIPTSEMLIVKKTLEEFKDEFPEVHYTIDEDIVKISAVGVGMRSHPGVAAKVFEALEEENIEIQMITTSEIRISCIIKKEYEKLALNKIAEEFKLVNEIYKR